MPSKWWWPRPRCSPRPPNPPELHWRGEAVEPKPRSNPWEVAPGPHALYSAKPFLPTPVQARCSLITACSASLSIDEPPSIIDETPRLMNKNGTMTGCLESKHMSMPSRSVRIWAFSAARAGSSWELRCRSSTMALAVVTHSSTECVAIDLASEALVEKCSLISLSYLTENCRVTLRAKGVGRREGC